MFTRQSQRLAENLQADCTFMVERRLLRFGLIFWLRISFHTAFRLSIKILAVDGRLVRCWPFRENRSHRAALWYGWLFSFNNKY